MNILIANNFYAPDVVGGAELSVQGIAEGLARRGHNVTLLTTAMHDEDTTLNGVAICRRRFHALMPYIEHVHAHVSPKKIINKVLTIDNPRNAQTIAKVIELHDIDVVLSNNLLGITVELWRTAHRLGIPTMHTLRDCALLCPNSTIMCDSRPLCGESPKVACGIMRKWLKKASELVSTVSAPSQYTLETHRREGFFPYAKACVIRNAVAFDDEAVEQAVAQRRASAQAMDDRSLRIVYLGRLVEEKGIRVLMDAFEMCKPHSIEAHFAGAGPLEGELKRLHDEGKQVYLHGFLSQDEVHELLMSCDVLVAPSVCPEAFGRIVLDAYIHAMPAIVSNAGGLPEILRSGTGMVVDSGSVVQLQRALQSYSDDRDKVIEQGIAGAQNVREFTVERQVIAFEEELTRLL